VQNFENEDIEYSLYFHVRVVDDSDTTVLDKLSEAKDQTHSIQIALP